MEDALICTAFHNFRFDLPEESVILTDKAYNDYALEDSLKEEGIHLMPIRKKIQEENMNLSLKAASNLSESALNPHSA